MTALEDLLAHKAAGNECYKTQDYAGAIAGYSKAVALLPREADSDDEDEGAAAKAAMSAADPELLKQGAIVLCNRAASFMGQKKAIAALADAQRAAGYDPKNWKAHWRTGLSLMMMAPRLERSEQAIEAFQRTLDAPTLPAGERENAQKALQGAKYRLEQGKDAIDVSKAMENCVVC